jgi:hypothetical protein
MSRSGASKGMFAELQLRQHALEVREPSLGGHVSVTESLLPPLGDRMQRRVLEELRAAPFEPGMRDLTQPTMKFFNQTGCRGPARRR